MTQYAVLVSFVDGPNACYAEVSQDSINNIKRETEPLKGFNEPVYEIDADHWLVISDSIQKACYIILCKELQDHTQHWTKHKCNHYADYVAEITKRSIETLLTITPISSFEMEDFLLTVRPHDYPPLGELT